MTHTGPGAPFGESNPGGEPPKRTRRWLRRLGVILLVLLAVVLGAVAAVAFLAKQEINDLVKAETPEQRATQSQLAKPLAGKPTNILVLGSDHRTGTGDDDRRSDTMLLVRLDPQNRSISMLSIPRDLYVNIPGHGQSKINDAYSLGGAELSVKTIKEVTGLDVNFTMDIDFKGFRGVVDTLGGIWVDVDRDYLIGENTGIAAIDVDAGYQRLYGKQALQYARYRHDGRSDFNRIARQQQVLAGLKKQLGAKGVASNIPGLFRVFRKNTTVLAGGGEVPAGVLYNYLRLALALEAKDVYQIEYDGTTGTAGEQSIVEYEQGKMDAAVKAFLSPSAKAREASADQLVGKQPANAEPVVTDKSNAAAPPAVPDPATISVTVLNGSGVGGAAGGMASKLTGVGYKVDPKQSNADNSNYANTKIFYADNGSKPAAEALSASISGSSVQAKDVSNAFTTKLLVVVGRTGTDVKAGSGSVVGADEGPSGGEENEANAVPIKAAARVTADAEYGRDDFSTVGKLAFPVLYPTVREQSSSYEEVRSYKIAKGEKGNYDAYRLVAQTGEGDYWGLQGTNWPDPPILDSPTRETRVGNRNYKLFFNGTKLHVVAWREGTGTYWISNSVLNNLSNETMLAIANGVKPYV